LENKILVLLVEDQQPIQLILEDVLISGGYSTMCASSGEEAIALLEAQQEKLSGIVTDIRLGSAITGWEVAERARELWSDVAVVYVTGDSAGEWPVRGVPKSIVLQKPFANAQLLTAISSLLNEAGAAQLG
jgi:CheY-like chemotaxis protein